MTANRKALSRIATAGLVAVLTVCSGCGSDGSGGVAADIACSAAGQKQFVLDTMEDLYFWNDQIADADPNAFATAEEYLDALLFKPIDRFSFIGSAAADRAFFSAGQFAGFGFSWKFTDLNEVRLTRVFSGSPAAQAGFQRGFFLLAVDGRAIAEIEAAEGVSAALGPGDVGVSRALRIRDIGGAESDVSLTKAVVTIDPVPISTVFDVGGVPTGYLVLATFVDPSVPALNAAFSDFASQGVQDVILDLRYNGGGLVAAADHLGDLLAAFGNTGLVFSETLFNANNGFRNTTRLFVDQAASVNINRLVVITTGGTASASELIINSMFPYLDVTLVGSDTFGKPVGQFGFTFCDKVLRPITFETVNADGAGGYFDGLAADCVAADDVDFLRGDPSEASLAEAIAYLQTGVCTPVAQEKAAELAAQRALTMKSAVRDGAARPYIDAN